MLQYNGTDNSIFSLIMISCFIEIRLGWVNVCFIHYRNQQSQSTDNNVKNCILLKKYLAKILYFCFNSKLYCRYTDSINYFHLYDWVGD